MFCAVYKAYQYKPRIEKMPGDKMKHCTMSCWVAQDCGTTETYLLGWLKEFVDLFTSGTPSGSDLKANKRGLKIAKKVTTKKQCTHRCRTIYPKYKKGPFGP